MSAPDTTDTNNSQDRSAQAAANIARAKLSSLYKKEPSVKAEIEEVKEEKILSKHQKYMDELTKSGKSLEEIQTSWHQYYQDLPDDEKHEVWQEFYETHKREKAKDNQPEEKKKEDKKPEKEPKQSEEGIKELKQTIQRKVSSESKISKKQHLKSILFGLSAGSIAVLIILFGFFNERFIAPFITPSRSVSNTPIIIDPDTNVAGPGTEVIIPKINVEIPVVYDSPSVVKAKSAEQLEAGIQKTLEDGVVHYPTTSKPGETGNIAIVGHSSNNIFNQGKYKFAFVLLSKLDKGDTFFLTRNKIRYTYKIFEKRVVKPTDVSILEDHSKKSTATLITCDPPGTSINRLIVVGEQISPSPTKNKKAKEKPTIATPEVVPGNAPSLWSRFINWVF